MQGAPRRRGHNQPMVRIEVCNDDYENPAFAMGGEVRVVEGRGDTQFADCLATALGRVRDSSYSVVVGDPSLYIPIAIDPEVTFAQVADFTRGEPLHVDAHERGGDGATTLLELVNAGLTLLGLWEAGVKIGDVAAAKRYALQRQAAREWIERGSPDEPAMNLVQLVKAERNWTLEIWSRFRSGNRPIGPSSAKSQLPPTLRRRRCVVARPGRLSAPGHAAERPTLGLRRRDATSTLDQGVYGIARTDPASVSVSA